MTTQLTGDTETGQEKNLFSTRRWLLSPQRKQKTGEMVGKGKSANQSQEESKSYE